MLSGVRLARLYLPRMRRQNWGRIIFISSESGLQIPTEMIHYGVTKTAQIAVARGHRGDGRRHRHHREHRAARARRGRAASRTSSTTMSKQAGITPAEFEADFFATARPTSLIKRFATPEEVASMVAYVASPLASATTGAALRVDGGVVKSAF